MNQPYYPQENQVPVPTPAQNEILIKVQYSGVNLIDTYLRTGIYPLPALPYTAGGEAAGVVVRLPTDPAILEHPAYKARNYRIGQTVAVVS
jgi:NADPH:quinone reductase-like Zn-dependent oxidoreductase